MKKIKQLIIAGFIICLALPTAVFAIGAPPAIPLLVYGEVKIDGLSAPIGTVVTIYNGAAEVARVALSQAGKYLLNIPAGNAGAKLSYKVNGILAAEKLAANPIISPSDKIDLAITTPSPAPASVPPTAGQGGNSGGGGGGSSITYCASVAYGQWGLCVNGFQQRIVSASTPTSCGLTTAQQLDSSRACVLPQVLGEKIKNPEIIGQAISSSEAQLNRILTDAAAVYSESIDAILINASSTRDAKMEKNVNVKYLSNLIHNEKNFLDADANRLNYFITYGTAGTIILGAGERAGVIGSYRSAFGKLPKTETDWQDAIKIANGRWPSERNTAAETKVKASFRKIYGREASLNNANDNAAVTIMAYGLRPRARNLSSEKAAILSFKYFFKRAPTTAVDWDAVRAIAYSGAKR